MCSWAMKVAQGCELLMDFMKEYVLESPVIGINETTVNVLKAPKKSNCYMWVFKGGTPDHPVIMFQYHPSRSGDVASQFLKGYQGIVQTDGYVGYDFLDTKPGIIHVACWVHARRKFVDVAYKIENEARELNLIPDQLYQKRQEEAVPILNEFNQWLHATVEKVPPKSLLGNAINYTLNQWPKAG